MKYDPFLHHRRSIRLKEYDYSLPGAYFVTVVTKDRVNLFGEIIDEQMRINPLGAIIQSVWSLLPGFFNIQLDEWVIMPNHLHGIIWILDNGRGEAFDNANPRPLIPPMSNASLQQPIGTKPGSLGAIIQNFKSVSTRRIHHYMHMGEASAKISVLSPVTPANASPQQ